MSSSKASDVTSSLLSTWQYKVNYFWSGLKTNIDKFPLLPLLDFPGQEKLTLTADITYKSNWQQGALKGTVLALNIHVASACELTHFGLLIAKRRNKWICALKTTLAELKIYGPKGDPDPPPNATRYTQVPWELVEAKDREDAEKNAVQAGIHVPAGGWELRDRNDAIGELSMI
jgi:hypothetical protein